MTESSKRALFWQSTVYIHNFDRELAKKMFSRSLQPSWYIRHWRHEHCPLMAMRTIGLFQKQNPKS